MCAVWPVLCTGVARRCDFCDKSLSLCQDSQGNVFGCLPEFVLGLIIMYWDYIIQKWSPSRASCHLFAVSLVPEQLRSWCGAEPCVDWAAGLRRNGDVSSRVSPAWVSAELSVSWWRRRWWVRIVMPVSVFQQAVPVSGTENVELLVKRSRSQGCQLRAGQKRISCSSSRGLRSPERNKSLKNNASFVRDAWRWHLSAPCETCCPWKCFHAVVKPWALSSAVGGWAVENVSQVSLSTDEMEPVWCVSLNQLAVLRGVELHESLQFSALPLGVGTGSV